MLLDIRNVDVRQGWDRLWLGGHAKVAAHEIDLVSRPLGLSDVCRDWKCDASTSQRQPPADLEAEPVAEFEVSCNTEVLVGGVRRSLPREINVDSRPKGESPRQKCGGPLDDPALIDPVEPFEEPVVGKLSLKLRERPSARLEIGRAHV